MLRGLSLDPGQRFASMEELIARLASPPIARRWAVRAAALLVVLGLGALASRELLAGRQALCSGAEQRLAGVWDVAIVRRVESAFTATGKPWAATSYASVKSSLDRYAREWTAMHTEACEATAVRGEQSPALLDLRMACLDRRLSKLEALTALLARADTQVVEKAVAAVEQLSPVAACADLAALTAAIKPPSSPALRAQVEALRHRLDQAKALQDAGKYAQGQPIAAAAVTEALRLPYRPIQAEALLRLGAIQLETDASTGESTLMDADWAAEASGDDELAVQTKSHLTFVVGFRQGRTEEGHRWARWASALLERVGDHGLLTAHHLNNLGAVYFTEGKYAEAVDHFRRSAELKEQLLGPESHDFAISLGNLGLAYTRLGKHQKALECFHRAIAIDEKALGAHHPTLANNLANLALLNVELGDYSQGVAYAQRVLEVLGAASDSGTDASVEALDVLGRAYARQGNYPEAIHHYERALAIRKKLNGPQSPSYASLLVASGHVYLEQRNLARADSSFREALGVFEQAHGPQHPEVARPLAGLGRLSLVRGKPALASSVLERALPLTRGTEPDALVAAEVRFLLAQALWQTQREPRRAIELAEQARRLYERAGLALKATEVDRWLARRLPQLRG